MSEAAGILPVVSPGADKNQEAVKEGDAAPAEEDTGAAAPAAPLSPEQAKRAADAWAEDSAKPDVLSALLARAQQLGKKQPPGLCHAYLEAANKFIMHKDGDLRFTQDLHTAKWLDHFAEVDPSPGRQQQLRDLCDVYVTLAVGLNNLADPVGHQKPPQREVYKQLVHEMLNAVQSFAQASGSAELVEHVKGQLGKFKDGSPEAVNLAARGLNLLLQADEPWDPNTQQTRAQFYDLQASRRRDLRGRVELALNSSHSLAQGPRLSLLPPRGSKHVFTTPTYVRMLAPTQQFVISRGKDLYDLLQAQYLECALHEVLDTLASMLDTAGRMLERMDPATWAPDPPGQDTQAAADRSHQVVDLLYEIEWAAALQWQQAVEPEIPFATAAAPSTLAVMTGGAGARQTGSCDGKASSSVVTLLPPGDGAVLPPERQPEPCFTSTVDTLLPPGGSQPPPPAAQADPDPALSPSKQGQTAPGTVLGTPPDQQAPGTPLARRLSAAVAKLGDAAVAKLGDVGHNMAALGQSLGLPGYAPAPPAAVRWRPPHQPPPPDWSFPALPRAPADHAARELDLAALRLRAPRLADGVRNGVRKLHAALSRVALAATPRSYDVHGAIMRLMLPRVQAFQRALDAGVAPYLAMVAGAAARGDPLAAAAQLSPSFLPAAASGLAARLADPGAVLLVALKALRLLIQAGALYVAEKVFAQRLVRRVYGEGDNPPKLYGMLLTFMCLDATMQVLAVLLLVLLSYVCKTGTNSFAVDDSLLVAYMADFFSGTLAVGALGLVLASLLRRKRYFEYPTQGRVVCRAYRDMMLGACGAVALVPFFAFFL